MKKERCARWKECRNGCDGCWSLNPETCVRFCPVDGCNIIDISGIVEVPPEIDSDKFSQYFTNWIDAMGWSYCGTVNPHKES